MENGKEDFINSVNLNINTDFPYLVLDVINDKSYPRNPGFQVMHWHEDLQFIYVLNGMIEVRTLDNAIRVQAGEAIFINKNVVHMVSRLVDCHYNSFIFPAYFLEFYPGSPAKIFVENITANEQLSVFRFSSLVEWHKDMTVILQQLVEIERIKTAFYAYEVLVRLSALWLIMRKNITIPPERKESVVNLRMQKILRYIEEHYAEDITLADLSKAQISANQSVPDVSN